MSQRINKCDSCPNAKSRKQTPPVLGAGSSRPLVMFVGDVPSGNDFRTGKPFSNSHDTLFKKTLRELGVVRGDVYVTNVIKCSPGNDKSLSAYVCAMNNLVYEIDQVQPYTICFLGSFASKTAFHIENIVYKGKESLGESFFFKDYPSISARSPATLNESNIDHFKKMVQHLLEFGRNLKEGRLSENDISEPASDNVDV